MKWRIFRAEAQPSAIRPGTWIHQASFGSLVGAGLAVLAGLLFCNEFLGFALIHTSYDLPFDFRGPARLPDVVIVEMNEASREILHQSWNRPWDRRKHAELLERLKADGARAVVFDLLFSREVATNDLGQIDRLIQEDISEANRLLAQAMRTNGPVIIGAHFRKAAKGASLEVPEPRLAEAATAVGLLETYEDIDTTVRKMLTQVPIGQGTNWATLDWEAARVLGAVRPNQPHPPVASSYLNYYGPPGAIPHRYYDQVLLEPPSGYFANKVVIVGEFYPVRVAAAGIDTFLSPFSFSSETRFSGAEIHATILGNLLRGEWLRRLSGPAEFGVMAILGGGIGFLLPRLRPLAAGGVALGAMALLTLIAFQLHWKARIWFPWLIPVGVQIPTGLMWAILFDAMRSHMGSQVLEQSLAHYLSPRQVKSILQRPELLRPGGVQGRISLLASDIANFSKISEQMDAEDIVQLLNQYYEEVIECVHQTDGAVVNLLGDSMFAIWNAPQQQADHPLRALRTALLLHSRVDQFNQRTDVRPLDTRVGLHTGTACVGNLGSSTHFVYTAIGEAVNLTFRLEGLNKHLDTRILATRDFLKAVGEHAASRSVGHFRFQGFDAVVEVHEILGLREDGETTPAWCAVFARGVHHFRRREFDAAAERFQETMTLHPQDGPAKFYLAKLWELRSSNLSRQWVGEIELSEK